MTRTELLKLVIAQARTHGFEFKRWYMSRLGREWTTAAEAADRLSEERRYYALLFSHDFASTFWKAGTEMTVQMAPQTFTRRMADGGIGTVERKGHLRRMTREDAWRFHLKEMAVSEEPLRYIRKFLRVQEELQEPAPPIVIIDEEDLLPDDD